MVIYTCAALAERIDFHRRETDAQIDHSLSFAFILDAEKTPLAEPAADGAP